MLNCCNNDASHAPHVLMRQGLEQGDIGGWDWGIVNGLALNLLQEALGGVIAAAGWIHCPARVSHHIANSAEEDRTLGICRTAVIRWCDSIQNAIGVS
eukprot:6200934-Pleurochrysis_carterae.AAC.2